jgi:hypothetical protein
MIHLGHTSSGESKAGEEKESNTLYAFTSFMNNVRFLNPSNLLKSHRQQIKSFTTKSNLKMPLVVPGINSGGAASKTDEWTNKLVGKKLGEGSSDEVVRLSIQEMR